MSGRERTQRAQRPKSGQGEFWPGGGFKGRLKSGLRRSGLAQVGLARLECAPKAGEGSRGLQCAAPARIGDGFDPKRGRERVATK
jgi:hypothetical protein